MTAGLAAVVAFFGDLLAWLFTFVFGVHFSSPKKGGEEEKLQMMEGTVTTPKKTQASSSWKTGKLQKMEGTVITPEKAQAASSWNAEKLKKMEGTAATPEKVQASSSWNAFENEMGSTGLSKDDMKTMHQKVMDLVNGGKQTGNAWNAFQALLKEYDVYTKCQPVNKKWEKLKLILRDSAWTAFEKEMDNTGLSKEDLSSVYHKTKSLVNGKGQVKNAWNTFQALLKEYGVYTRCEPVNEKWEKLKLILKDN